MYTTNSCIILGCGKPCNGSFCEDCKKVAQADIYQDARRWAKHKPTTREKEDKRQ